MTPIARFKSCMHANIADTLNVIDRLKLPVARSCHIGNNTSNNWGLLGLSKNIQLVQYDHTSYGLDENCAPWLVLDNNGLISKCYDHKGIDTPKQCGIHINLHIKNINDKKYTQHLNYGIFPQFDGIDLINYHYNTAIKLSKQINDSNITFDTKEMLNAKEILGKIFKTFFYLRKLNLIFDRWVLKSKKGYVVMLKIGTINYISKDIIEIHTNNKLRVFLGSIETLIEQFFANIQIVHDRIIYAKFVTSVSYPWVNLKFSYLIPTLKEFAVNPDQKVFWHAGGSASQYYINNSTFIAEMDHLISELIINKFLPTNVYINLIPSFCCQLFATNLKSLPILEDIISIWISYKKINKNLLNNIISTLAIIDHPLNTIKSAFKNIDNKIIDQLKRSMLDFNAKDINKLPIAHIINCASDSYNKYGVSQHNLVDKEILIPSNFKQLSWGEAELLIKILAEAVITESY